MRDSVMRLSARGLLLDPMAEMYIIGSEIDYVTELGGSFLAVKNPTAASSCGCGDSFGI